METSVSAQFGFYVDSEVVMTALKESKYAYLTKDLDDNWEISKRLYETFPGLDISSTYFHNVNDEQIGFFIPSATVSSTNHDEVSPVKLKVPDVEKYSDGYASLNELAGLFFDFPNEKIGFWYASSIF